MVELALEILRLVEQGMDLKKCYLTRFEKLEQEGTEFRKNRMKLRQYLRQVYLGLQIQHA